MSVHILSFLVLIEFRDWARNANSLFNNYLELVFNQYNQERLHLNNTVLPMRKKYLDNSIIFFSYIYIFCVCRG